VRPTRTTISKKLLRVTNYFINELGHSKLKKKTCFYEKLEEWSNLTVSFKFGYVAGLISYYFK